jgi:hypothetical protein
MVVFAMPERAATASTVTARGPFARSSAKVASVMPSSTSCRCANIASSFTGGIPPAEKTLHEA